MRQVLKIEENKFERNCCKVSNSNKDQGILKRNPYNLKTWFTLNKRSTRLSNSIFSILKTKEEILSFTRMSYGTGSWLGVTQFKNIV